MLKTLLRTPSTDSALFVCFDYLLFAKSPLELKMDNLKIPVSFFFGDKDWMRHLSKAGSLRVLDKNPFKDLHSHMHVIENSDHLLYFDNPKGFTDAILKDLANLHEI
jgi:pimeloyl-ACP methyl ester carboxylesterase